MKPTRPVDACGRYELKRELGRGGIGRVFLAHDRYLGHDVALKRMRHLAGDAGAIERFEREFAFLAGVDCPRVARAYDFGYLDGEPFFTSEFIDGDTLAVRRERRTPAEITALARELIKAVAFLHRSAILHLDIKPSNVILRGRSEPVLIDFGLVRRGLDAPAPDTVLGSLPYMAPEYFRGGDIGPWTDVYALGATLFELATGHPPRPLGAVDGATHEPRWTTVASVGDRRAVAPALEAVILKSLALDPTLRFGSAIELLESLEADDALDVRGDPIELEASPAPRTVGYRSELDDVDAFLDSCHPPWSASRVLVVTGFPGAGQSHLLREIKIRAQTRGRRVYLETLYPGRRTEPGSVLRCLAAHMSDESARSRWRGFLARLRRPSPGLSNHTLHGERRVRRVAEVALAARAVAEPVLVVIDGLQHCDEVSIEIVSDLARTLHDGAAESPLALVLAYREEGPVLSALGELTRLLVRERAAPVISLRGLGVEETAELYRRFAGAEEIPCGEFELFQCCRGAPARLLELTPRGVRSTDDEREETGVIESPDSRDIALALELLMRPATAAEVARIVDRPRTGVRGSLEELESSGRVTRVERLERPRGRIAWLRTPALAALASEASGDERRELHERIGDVLAESASGASDPALAEAVRHFHAAECSRKFLEHAPSVAAYLRATFQNRLALECHRGILELLPASRVKQRRDVVLEIAELHARVGSLDEGIHVLREFLFRGSGGDSTSGPSRVVLLRLATLYSRRGDFRRADALFHEGLSEEGRGRLTRSQRLYFMNEHAALKAFLGDHDAALALCDEGLRRAGSSRDRSVREVVLNMHATRATVALRRFELDVATREFERSLDIAEAIGSPVNQAVILNNLGAVHAKADRYPEAIRAFRDAERTCLQLDEGPSLASIWANLGILHAKIGDFDASDEAFREAACLERGAIGNREEFFLSHARGLAAVYRGRYADAKTHLDDAIARGESLGDHHVVRFERLFRAEALVFLARYREARDELERLADPEQAATLRRMALARLAFLDGVTGQAESLENRISEYDAVESPSRSELVDAWDAYFVARGLAMLAEVERAVARLEPALRYFEGHGMEATAALAACVKAEALLVRGETERAREALGKRSGGAGSSDLGRLESALLELRCLAVKISATGRQRASDLLADAGALLRRNELPEQRLRFEILRAHLGGRDGGMAEIDAKRRELACDLPEALRESWLESPSWVAWRRGLGEEGSRRDDVPGREAAESELATEIETARISGRAVRSRRESLVADSAAMKSVVTRLDRVRDSDLPVLVTGETGTGKELIARVLHEESPRRDRVFQVVDCAAIPESLLQVELFGAREGAFTDCIGDRKGILETASGGTMFIDEIANTSLTFQSAFLRVLAEGSIRALGAETETAIDVRFVMSTARDLDREVEAGRFREDLLHRINVLRIDLPPLRDRHEDFNGLVEQLVGPVKPAAIERLRAHAWPGNVRELRNFLDRCVLEASDDRGRGLAAAIDEGMNGGATRTIFPKNLLTGDDLPALRKRLEREYLVYHLRRLEGNAAALCEFLGLSRRQLYNRCERLGVSLREERRRMR